MTKCSLPLVIVIALISFSVPAKADFSWRKTSGQGSVLAIDPSSKVIYASGKHGVSKTTDAGTTWTFANNGLPDAEVKSFAIDPQYNNILYVGLAAGGIYKSTDGGATWNASNTSWPSSILSLCIDPTDTQTLYAGTYNGLFRSYDGGGSWSRVNLPLAPNSVVTNTTTIYACGWEGIFKSTDGGTTWAKLSSRSASQLVLDIKNPNVIYAATDAFGVQKSIDNGESWTSIGPSDEGIYSVALDSDKATVYASRASIGIHKLVFGGEWTALNKPLWLVARSVILDQDNSGILYAAYIGDGYIYKGANFPAILGVPATKVTAGNAYMFTPTASDAASFKIKNIPNWATFNTTTGSLTGAPTNEDAGIYNDIIITATNNAGSTDLAPFSITVSALPAPTISGTPAATVTTGYAYSFTPAATNAASFSISNKPSWANFNTSTGVLVGTPQNTDVDIYSNIIISATNYTGNVALPAFSITVALPQPTIFGYPVTRIGIGAQYSFSPYATNAEYFQVSNKPAWAQFDITTGVLKGTPGINDAGIYKSITISVANSTGTAYLTTFSITVVPKPTISGSPTNTVLVGESYTFTPDATDTEGFFMDNKPSWMNFNTPTGRLTGIPTAVDVGTYSGINVGAYNIAGSAFLGQFSIVVTMPPMPTISGTPNTDVTVDKAYSFIPTASGTKSFSIYNRPIWASFDAATGALTGTPTTADIGTYENILIMATNVTGAVFMPPFSITVNPPTASLSVRIVGTGGGTITSVPNGISCIANSMYGCLASFTRGTDVTLLASSDADSTFSGWSGDCQGTNGCSISMLSNQVVEASFSAAPNAKIGTVEYTSLSAAFTSVQDNVIIMARQKEFVENLILGSRTFTLQGGYDSKFSKSARGYTAIKGSLKIRGGRLTVDKLVVR